ncbi:hypothetical protein [Pseudoalteromonas prydzensis]|uniref:hypothetical protein n=1 Tax=Pseudoalteromonas prydzensis TaxID=182141 RepID=UPI0007E51553|nr:hypothetical protein [Pseudoalteromonas prydzensis]MBE0379227.1 hypothetical protein [Pseudoalteromonas prydzensis ACAM 620]
MNNKRFFSTIVFLLTLPFLFIGCTNIPATVVGAAPTTVGIHNEFVSEGWCYSNQKVDVIFLSWEKANNLSSTSSISDKRLEYFVVKKDFYVELFYEYYSYQDQVVLSLGLIPARDSYKDYSLLKKKWDELQLDDLWDRLIQKLNCENLLPY